MLYRTRGTAVKTYNKYIIVVAMLLLLTTVILTALGNTKLDMYYTLYVLEALIVTELYVHFNAKARHGLSLVSVVLLAGFLVTVSLQIVKIVA